MALSDGLLGGFADLVGGYFGRVQAAKQAAMDAPYRAQLQGLLGAPAVSDPLLEQGPPMPGQAVQQFQPGSGLLANPNDPRAQQTFAAGLMSLGGRYADTGANMLNAAFQRAQAGDQYNRTETRLNDQFGQTHSLALQQAQELRDNRDLQQQNWMQQFEAMRQEAAARLANDNARLALEGRRVGIAEQEAAARPTAEMPKLSPGYAYVKSPAGTVAAPIPGTPDYAKAVDMQKAFQGATREIQQLTDLMEGVTRDPATGAVRRGSAPGTELWGDTAAKMGTLRGQIISRIAKLRDMGVLQQGEMERIEEQLPDPTALGSKFRRNKSISTAYKTTAEMFQRRLDDHLQANPWLLPPVPGGQ